MNMKELEAAVTALQRAADEQGATIKALRAEWDDHRTSLNGLGARVADVFEAVTTLHGRVDELSNSENRQNDRNNSVAALISAMGVELGAVTVDLGATKEKLEAFGAQVDDLRMKVEGRNRSAPVKRNMTDDDALRVLNGDLKDVGHKEAAEKVGLTYAQVYSCRLGFTFKHVIKELEKGGWRSQWAKG